MEFDAGTWWLIGILLTDWTECHNDIKAIQRNFLTKEDYFREQAKTEKKLDQILNLLMKGRLSDE